MCQRFETEADFEAFRESEREAINIHSIVVTHEGIWVRYSFKV